MLTSSYAGHLGIPDEFAAQIIATGKDPAREALELIAIEGYRARRLNESEIRRMLGYGNRMQFHALLATHDIPLHYTLEHFEQDIKASDALKAERQMQAIHAE